MRFSAIGRLIRKHEALGAVNSIGVDGVASKNRARTGAPRMGLRLRGGEPGSLRSSLCPWGGDNAEPEGFGGSKVEGEKEIWPDFCRNPGFPIQ